MKPFFKYLLKAAILPALLLAAQFLNAQDAKIVLDTTETKEIIEDAQVPYDEEQSEPVYFSQKGSPLSVSQRRLSSQKVKKLKEDDDFWYADMAKEKEKKNGPGVNSIRVEPDSGQKVQKDSNDVAIQEQNIEFEEKDEYTPVGQRSWFQTLLWIVIIGVFIGALFLYLGDGSIGLFRKRNRNIAAADIEDETVTEDIFAINYQKDIDRAAAQGNYRLAIRLMFLRVLKNMSEKNIIRYKQDKTNMDYLMELHPTSYYNNFFRVTRNYEYSWYGQFAISEDAYRSIRNEFDQFDKVIRSA